MHCLSLRYAGRCPAVSYLFFMDPVNSSLSCAGLEAESSSCHHALFTAVVESRTKTTPSTLKRTNHCDNQSYSRIRSLLREALARQPCQGEAIHHPASTTDVVTDGGVLFRSLEYLHVTSALRAPSGHFFTRFLATCR